MHFSEYIIAICAAVWFRYESSTAVSSPTLDPCHNSYRHHFYLSTIKLLFTKIYLYVHLYSLMIVSVYVTAYVIELDVLYSNQWRIKEMDVLQLMGIQYFGCQSILAVQRRIYSTIWIPLPVLVWYESVSVIESLHKEHFCNSCQFYLCCMYAGSAETYSYILIFWPIEFIILCW